MLICAGSRRRIDGYRQEISFIPTPLHIGTRFRVVDGPIEEIGMLLYGQGATDKIADDMVELGRI